MLGAGFPAGAAGGWGGAEGEQQMWTQARQVMSGESLGDHPPSSVVGLWPPNHPNGGAVGGGGSWGGPSWGSGLSAAHHTGLSVRITQLLLGIGVLGALSDDQNIKNGLNTK